MSLSRKYGRTYHYPFSPGTTSDDRINHQYWEDIQQIDQLVHTEKLDGENTCLNQYGVFARSHAAPTRHPWAGYLKQRWELLKSELGQLEIFGENLYAIHSIEYLELEQHFFVFAIRELDQWLSWEEVKFYAALLDFPTVPEIALAQTATKEIFEQDVLNITQQPSAFRSIDVHSREACAMEGIVSRNCNAFAVEDFKSHVFKYVRKDHVRTDEHWTRKWKRAALKWEKSCGQ
ncbi:MAG: RNA ligase family protein [Bacteroidota bacterium]